MQNRSTIRNLMRAKRNALSTQQQELAALNLKNHLHLNVAMSKAQNIAAYLSYQNEIDPLLWLKENYHIKHCYLPVIDPQTKHIQFARFSATSTLMKNRYGILEPIEQQQIFCPLTDLDIVLLPLVAFDLQGHRIGTGAGYYDRTFAFLKQPNKSIKPKLIGLAYEFQKLDFIAAESWDVTLDAVITDMNIYEIRKSL